MSDRSDCADKARSQRELPPPAPDSPPDFRSWIHAGALAASSHNTQPWRVRLLSDEPSIVIQPDDRRRCPVVDPDDAHLFKSLGCMAENIRIAAGVNGYDTRIDVAGDTPEIRLRFQRSDAPGELDRYRAIAERQCTRSTYDGTPLTPNERDALGAAGRGSGVQMVMIEDAERIGDFADFVARGNEIQFGDPAFRRELAHWIRFDPAAALSSGDGLRSAVMEQPNLPQWIGRRLAPLLMRPSSQIRRDRTQIGSSSAIVVLVAERDEPEAWIETGRVVERLALEATVQGLKHAYVNPPIEVPSLREELAHWLEVAPQHPVLALRIGRADPVPYSLRRGVDEFLVEPADE